MVKDARAHVLNGAAAEKEKRAIRDGFGEGMVRLGESNPNVVALCADLTESDRLDKFREKFPQRFVEVGVAEQNLVGVAAGMAHTGKIAYAASFAVFCPGRSWDQVRVSVCYSNQNVKIYGGHAGLTVGEDGATHQALEDIAITRCLPRMTVIVPADATEMRKATIAAAEREGPVYLRGSREKLPQVTHDATPFVIGEANLLRDGKDVTIIACGVLVHEALLAADELAKRKIGARVLNMHTISPIDEHAIISAAHETGAIVTAEEHQVVGGLGGAVAEVLGTHYPVPLERVGVQQAFGESGTAPALLDKYGLRASNIAQAAERAVARKRKGPVAEFKPSGRDVKKLPASATRAPTPQRPAKQDTARSAVASRKTTRRAARKKRR